MSPIRIALEDPRRSLWITKRLDRLVVQLHDEVRVMPLDPIPLEVDILKQMTTGMPLECAFWNDTGRLTLKWEGTDLIALVETEERTIREPVNVDSLLDAAELLS